MAVLLMFLLIFANSNVVNLLDASNSGNNSTSSSSYDGLYSSEDKVVVLNSDNLSTNVYNSASAWLVQFYNSWCGHCINFSPVWKKLASDVYNWRGVVTIAAVNCADDKNTQLCREYEIMKYPTIQYFHPMIKRTNTIGIDFPKNMVYVNMRHSLLDFLETSIKDGWVINWNNLLPLKEDNISSVWESANNFIILVAEPKSSYMGMELILDSRNIKNLHIYRSNDKNIFQSKNMEFSLPSVNVVHKNSSMESLMISQNANRESVYESLAEFLIKNGQNVPRTLNIDHSTSTIPPSATDKAENTDLLVNKVYLVDLEYTIQYSLFHEIPLKPVIEDESLKALYNYLDVLDKFFPLKMESIPFFVKLKDAIFNSHSLTGDQFKTIAQNLQSTYYPIFSAKSNNWFGCRGSAPKYRGYPCGLWMTAHMLTVRAHDVESTKVLSAFAGYIKHFFGCNECSENFQKVSSSINYVNTLDESILWLWRTHNNVSQRLKGDGTEDPVFPKIQFPSPRSCSSCRLKNGMWNEKEVLKFLKNMYLRVNSYVQETPLNSRLAIEIESSGYLVNISDTNVCLGLYILCMIILVVYILKTLIVSKKPRKIKYSFKHEPA